MKIYVLIRDCVVHYRECRGILGIFDKEHIEEAAKLAQEKYPTSDIWVTTEIINNFDLIKR